MTNIVACSIGDTVEYQTPDMQRIDMHHPISAEGLIVMRCNAGWLVAAKYSGNVTFIEFSSVRRVVRSFDLPEHAVLIVEMYIDNRRYMVEGRLLEVETRGETCVIELHHVLVEPGQTAHLASGHYRAPLNSIKKVNGKDYVYPDAVNKEHSHERAR